jgi:hypothetical protein
MNLIEYPDGSAPRTHSHSLFIAYGSLYPGHFAPAHLSANPLWVLFHSWGPELGRYFLRDTIVNVVLYIPLGFAAHMVFRKSRLPGFAGYAVASFARCSNLAGSLIPSL